MSETNFFRSCLREKKKTTLFFKKKKREFSADVKQNVLGYVLWSAVISTGESVSGKRENDSDNLAAVRPKSILTS